MDKSCVITFHFTYLLGYTLNGELLLDAMGGEAAFSDIPSEDGKFKIQFFNYNYNTY